MLTKRLPFFTILFSCLFFPFSIFAKENVVNLQHWSTLNGAQIYFVEAKEIPIVDVQIVFAAGSAYDGVNYGLASATSSMLDEGTPDLNTNQIADTLDRLGAQFNTEVDRDTASVHLRTLSDPKYFNPAIKLFEKLLTQSSFPEESFSRVKQQILGNLAQQQQDPSYVASKTFYETIYKNTPYAHPTSGIPQTVQQLTAEQLKTFYKKYYVSDNAHVIIVGNLTQDRAKQLANQLTLSLPQGSKPHALEVVHPAIPGVVRDITFPSQQTTIILGQVGIAKNDPRYFPLLVGNWILGGMPLSSLLFEKVRNEKGLAYGVSSQFTSLAIPGPFSAALQTRSEKAKEALNITRQTIVDFLNSGPTEKQLAFAQQNLIGSFPVKLDSNQDILAAVSAIAFYNLPLDYLDRYRDNIRAVTIEQIKSAMREVLKPDALNVILVGPKKAEK